MKPGPVAPNHGTWGNSFHSSFLILKTILSSYQRVLNTRTVLIQLHTCHIVRLQMVNMADAGRDFKNGNH